MAEVKAASDAFHRHLRHLPRPAFMDIRDDPWAFGDRLARGLSRKVMQRRWR